MREAGYYWVFNLGCWQIFFWSELCGCWFAPGEEEKIRDSDLEEIDERRITREGE